MSKVPVAHIIYCSWLKTQVEICVKGTLDMSQAPLRHKWKQGLKLTPLHGSPCPPPPNPLSKRLTAYFLSQTLDHCLASLIIYTCMK